MERGWGLFGKSGKVHKSGNLTSIYFHSQTSLPWTSRRFCIFVLFIPALHTIHESLRGLLKNKLNCDPPALLLSFLNQMLQRFPMAVRCKLKFHLELQSTSWSSLFLPLLTQSHHFPPFVILNIRFSSATEWYGTHLLASHSTSSLLFLRYSNAPFSIQHSCNFYWVIVTCFNILILQSSSSV